MNKPRGAPFQPGKTFGRGRPKGSRNKSTQAALGLLEKHHESLMAKQLKAAHDGDAKARQWCLEQLQRLPAPVRKLKLQRIQTLDDLEKASETTLELIAQRRITIAEGGQMMNLLEQKRKLIETQQLGPRMEELERLIKSHRR